MGLSPNKASIEIIKDGAFGGSYFRDILILIKKGIKIDGKNLFI